MNNTENTKVNGIMAEEQKQSEQVREQIAQQLKALGYGALLWGENVFGTTNYPLISDDSGRNFNVHGVRLMENDEVYAEIAYPSGENITGVKGFYSQDAAGLIQPSALVATGSPEEWEILGDCFATAIQILKAQGQKDRPMPWW